MNCRTPYYNKTKWSLFAEPPHGGAFPKKFSVDKGHFFMSSAATLDKGDKYESAGQSNLRSPCELNERSSCRPQMEITKQSRQDTLDNATQRVYREDRHNYQSLPFPGKRHDEPTNFLESNQGTQGVRLAGGCFSWWIPQTPQQVSSNREAWILHTQGFQAILRGTLYKGVNFFILNKHGIEIVAL